MSELKSYAEYTIEILSVENHSISNKLQKREEEIFALEKEIRRLNELRRWKSCVSEPPKWGTNIIVRRESMDKGKYYYDTYKITEWMPDGDGEEWLEIPE